MRGVVGVVVVALAVAAGGAGADTVRERARFRDAPNVDGALLGTLSPSTEVTVHADERGWKRVTTPDGTTGWVWGDHLAQATTDDAPVVVPDTPRPSPVADTARPAATGPRATADELRELRAEITALRERPEPASAADLERIRSELDRLVTAERDLARRFDERRYPGTTPLDAPSSHPFPTAIAAFVAGGIGGLLIGRFARRRRDRRSRSRLSF